MVELQSGSIVIDGVNVAHLPLDEVRSRLAIIPQDPFLFSGSVRENLDPTDVYSDAQLWSAVERCHVKTVSAPVPYCAQLRSGGYWRLLVKILDKLQSTGVDSVEI